MTAVSFSTDYPALPHAYGEIRVSLIDGGAGGAHEGRVIGDTAKVRLDADGEATVDLARNDEIMPAGTFYRCEIHCAHPRVVRHIAITSDTAVSWANPAIQVAPVPLPAAVGATAAYVDAGDAATLLAAQQYADAGGGGGGETVMLVSADSGAFGANTDGAGSADPQSWSEPFGPGTLLVPLPVDDVVELAATVPTWTAGGAVTLIVGTDEATGTASVEFTDAGSVMISVPGVSAAVSSFTPAPGQIVAGRWDRASSVLLALVGGRVVATLAGASFPGVISCGISLDGVIAPSNFTLSSVVPARTVGAVVEGAVIEGAVIDTATFKASRTDAETAFGIYSLAQNLLQVLSAPEGIFDRWAFLTAVATTNVNAATLVAAGSLPVMDYGITPSLPEAGSTKKPWLMLFGQTTTAENGIYEISADGSCEHLTNPAIFDPPGNGYRLQLSAPGEPVDGMWWIWQDDAPSKRQRASDLHDAPSATGRWIRQCPAGLVEIASPDGTVHYLLCANDGTLSTTTTPTTYVEPIPTVPIA